MQVLRFKHFVIIRRTTYSAAARLEVCGRAQLRLDRMVQTYAASVEFVLTDMLKGLGRHKSNYVSTLKGRLIYDCDIEQVEPPDLQSPPPRSSVFSCFGGSLKNDPAVAAWSHFLKTAGKKNFDLLIPTSDSLTLSVIASELAGRKQQYDRVRLWLDNRDWNARVHSLGNQANFWFTSDESDKKYLLRQILDEAFAPLIFSRASRISAKGWKYIAGGKSRDPLLNYQLVKELGRGVGGIAYLCYHKGHPLVVKKIKYPQNIDSLYKEIICSIVLSGHEKGVRLKKILTDPASQLCFIVMEVLEEIAPNSPLAEAVRTDKRRISWPTPEHPPYNWIFQQYGIVIQDRQEKNFMARGDDFVLIDYGRSQIDWDKLSTYANSQ